MEEILKAQLYLWWLEEKLNKEKVPLRKLAIMDEIRKYKRILKEEEKC